MNWSTKEVTTVVDIVKESANFPGIFSIKFPDNCWSLDNKRILISTHWRKANVGQCISFLNFLTNFLILFYAENY